MDEDTLIGWIFIIIVGYIVYRRRSKKKTVSYEEFEDIYDEDDELEDEDGFKSPVLELDVLKIASYHYETPSIQDFYGISADALTAKLRESPIQVEKFVNTIILLKGTINRMYVQEDLLYVEIGDASYGDSFICNRYTCSILGGFDIFKASIERLTKGDYIELAGLLTRRHSNDQYPQYMPEAMLVKVNKQFTEGFNDLAEMYYSEQKKGN